MMEKLPTVACGGPPHAGRFGERPEIIAFLFWNSAHM